MELILGVFYGVLVGMRLLIGWIILCWKIKVSCKIKFVANKTPAKVIKEGAFGGTYFRDIYSGVNGTWYKKSWKKSDQLKDID